MTETIRNFINGEYADSIDGRTSDLIDPCTGEVFASAVGGVRLVEPGADLPICLALVSALLNVPLPPDLVVFGEVGLAGELRQVAHASRRLAEAARMGFTRAIVPSNSPPSAEGITLLRVATVSEALAAAGLCGRAAAIAS